MEKTTNDLDNTTENSKEIFGYKLKKRTIQEILRRNNRIDIITKEKIIPFSNNVPPHNVHYGFPL